jgi:hypothetical protein
VIHRLHPDGSRWIPIVFETQEKALKMYIEQCEAELARAFRRQARAEALIDAATYLLRLKANQ